MYSITKLLFQNSKVRFSPENGLIILFFLSGFSALCYQLVWQRTLFATFGINIESVTIIVSLFMFGLGIGALLGAKLEKYPQHLLRLFIGFELLIALFGVVSRPIIIWLGSFQHIDSLWSIAFYTYMVFALPTLLMGATLPLLVSYINKHVGHTGKSMGWLYASNTFGAAAAAFITVTLFFVFWGLNTTIIIAVCLNITTALLAYLLYNQLPYTLHTKELPAETLPDTENLINASPAILLALSFLMGYVALSQELVWYRVLGFLSANHSIIFGLMLSVFLIGVAGSAVRSSKAYTSATTTITYIFTHLLGLLLVWYIAFPLMAKSTAFGGKALGLLMGFLLTGIVAFLCGGIFPVLCHLLQARTRESAGSVVGKLYFANVMGATIGPLLTGFVFFEYFSLQASIFLIGVLTAIIILFLAARSSLARSYKYGLSATCLLVTALGYGLHISSYDRFFETLQFGIQSPPPFEAFNSNRNGIIGVAQTAVYGNGAYDGKMNLDPYQDINGITRAYAIAAFHPNPKRILLIGVSGGSWTQALAFYQPLEQIIAVEINKGYLDIISQYPDHTDMLNNPKVKLTIDDGRRWVRNHPEQKFDVIVMNTIYHWRSNATNMLSKEFFELCRQRLNPGGYVFINNTGAKEVAYTAAHVFNYVSVAFDGKMVIAGDVPSEVSREAKIGNLKKFIHPDGQPVFKNDSVLNAIASLSFPDQKKDILSQNNVLVITDDNMATEFKK
jgi:spermidine synthase